MTPEEIEFQLMSKKSIEYRGHVLHLMAYLEFMLNAYISRRYCTNEDMAQEMIVTILGDDRISLNSKVQVFYAIATKHDGKWYNSYVSTRKPTSKKGSRPSLNNDLTYVVEERNIFAHKLFAATELFPNNPKGANVVRFVKFKNDITSLDYDDEKINDLYALIMNIGKHFSLKDISF